MSVDALRRLLRGDLAEDLERMRTNMQVLLEKTASLPEIERLMREAVEILRRIEECLCRGDR